MAYPIQRNDLWPIPNRSTFEYQQRMIDPRLSCGLMEFGIPKLIHGHPGPIRGRAESSVELLMSFLRLEICRLCFSNLAMFEESISGLLLFGRV